MSGTDTVRIGLPAGLWLLRDQLGVVTSAVPRRLRPSLPTACDLFAARFDRTEDDWVRDLARRRAMPLLHLGASFLGPLRFGDREVHLGFFVDRRGSPWEMDVESDFEAAVARRAAETGAAEAATRTRVAAAMAELAHLRLSRAPCRTAMRLGDGDLVVVLDQDPNDPSARAVGGDRERFEAMFETATAECDGRPVVLHPVFDPHGRPRSGHLLDLARRRGVRVLEQPVDPWDLFEAAATLHTVADPLGWDAVLAGRRVVCHGAAPFAGRGLTEDRILVDRKGARPSLAAFAAASWFDATVWRDPWRGREIAFEEAIEHAAFLRDRLRENRPAVCVGTSAWKRPILGDFLAGCDGPPRFARTLEDAAATTAERLVVWGSRAVDADAARGRAIVRAEDGFLRSVGLGAAFVRPASLVFDPVGIYYDQSRPSAFETIARTARFEPSEIARAVRLRRVIVEERLSKYNQGQTSRFPERGARRRILVPGQVVDDASVRFGSPEVRSDLELLRRVRARHPEAEIVYKPHPDVVAGYRDGAVPVDEALRLADMVVTDIAITDLFADVDAVETMTSLAGFEALLRGLPVTTHGVPFYAGWGLTEDLLPCPRRDRRLTLDELVAVALVLYPRYVDPLTRLPCPVEVIVEAVLDRRARRPTIGDRLRGRIGHLSARLLHLAGLARRRRR